MTKFRTSIQHDRLLKNISTYGTEYRSMQRKAVLDEVRRLGSVSTKEAAELLGLSSAKSSATRLLAELVEEGVLERVKVSRHSYYRLTKYGAEMHREN